MSKRPNIASVNRRAVKKIVVVQVITLLILSAIGLYWSVDVARSLLIGGGICILPGAYFSFKYFKHAGAQQARNIVRDFYFGELVKLVATIGLFILAFKFAQVLPGPLFIGYALAMLCHWCAPLYTDFKN